eukprot:scaffold626_cov409-Prasinococcus_capsulatus_cf.AAC.25
MVSDTGASYPRQEFPQNKVCHFPLDLATQPAGSPTAWIALPSLCFLAQDGRLAYALHLREDRLRRKSVQTLIAIGRLLGRILQRPWVRNNAPPLQLPDGPYLFACDLTGRPQDSHELQLAGNGTKAPAAEITRGMTSRELVEALKPLEKWRVIEFSSLYNLFCGFGRATEDRDFDAMVKPMMDHRMYFCFTEPWVEAGRPRSRPWLSDVVLRHCGKTEATMEREGLVKRGELSNDPECSCEFGYGMPPAVQQAPAWPECKGHWPRTHLLAAHAAGPTAGLASVSQATFGSLCSEAPHCGPAVPNRQPQARRFRHRVRTGPQCNEGWPSLPSELPHPRPRHSRAPQFTTGCFVDPGIRVRGLSGRPAAHAQLSSHAPAGGNNSGGESLAGQTLAGGAGAGDERRAARTGSTAVAEVIRWSSRWSDAPRQQA